MGTHPDNRNSDPPIQTDSDVGTEWYHPSSLLLPSYRFGRFYPPSPGGRRSHASQPTRLGRCEEHRTIESFTTAVDGVSIQVAIASHLSSPCELAIRFLGFSYALVLQLRTS